MDFDILIGFLILASGWLLMLCIPLGIYLFIKKRTVSKGWKWGSLGLVALGLCSAPAWLPMIAVTLMLFSGSSFS